ncbi:N-acetyltransferase [Flectobacillus sp. BAB-3569]|uniref:GNAT family N-acetyltransferase n=1 Tax=Flectobacillus sp. BAB-3569 TaxID=1509483 RepID=UPI000BA3EE98|nr:GNAT family N-acetyltransferase [Flectobacillus sp. BAB-3569]PAC26859.1 GNAT family N-acetyltransferase [Flectobacillus sp. BAB-3569]
MQITKASESHLELLVLAFDTYRVHFGQTSDLIKTSNFLKERFAQNSSTIFIALDDSNGALAGFTQLYPVYSTLKLESVWLLNDMFVMPDYRKGGVASLLIDAAWKHTKDTGAAWLTLKTGIENTKAQALYEKLGFRKDQEHFYYFLDNHSVKEA